ncbi:MAG: hypothetical protein JO286_02810 [Solirubrobacterales bacterium]|nr:hypothetical protein [Solirubrobacterales bacterium]MBV9806082.1 hypothetical protein [Solirubrobacterales bacterium]
MAVGPPRTVGFGERAELFERLAELERRIAWAAACDASRQAHLKIVSAADWLEDSENVLLRRVRRRRKLWSAVDELQARGTEFFYPPRPGHAVNAISMEDGSVAAEVDRLLHPSPAAAELTFDRVRSWLAGTVVLGDGEDSALSAERMEAVREQVNQLEGIAKRCYERAVSNLERTLLADAERRDETRARRMINAPMVESLNRRL